MTIVIPLEELKEETRPYFTIGTVSGLSIDYATNAIHGYVGGIEHIVFRFKDYGVYLDNRYNSYELTGGSAGILIKIHGNLHNGNSHP
jgi:hypothetical protein